MAWLKTKIVIENEPPVDNLINVDAIVRIGPSLSGGCYVHTIDGMSINIVDRFDSLVKDLFGGKE